jgi:hypothetical protein
MLSVVDGEKSNLGLLGWVGVLSRLRSQKIDVLPVWAPRILDREQTMTRVSTVVDDIELRKEPR